MRRGTYVEGMFAIPAFYFMSCASHSVWNGAIAFRRQAAHYNSAVYSTQLLDHFEHPRNGGLVENADVTVRLENPACGDILEFSAKLEGGTIVEIGFRAKGCVPAMACGSVMTELAKGKTVAAAKEISREDLLRAVGGVPEASNHASHLALDALQALLQNV
jgi:NifU-like protein involved in Fe-S cluster formation